MHAGSWTDRSGTRLLCCPHAAPVVRLQEVGASRPGGIRRTAGGGARPDWSPTDARRRVRASAKGGRARDRRRGEGFRTRTGTGNEAPPMLGRAARRCTLRREDEEEEQGTRKDQQRKYLGIALPLLHSTKSRH